MSGSEFENILNRPSKSIERPKPLPVGEYRCVIVGQPREDKSSKKGTPFVEFTLKVLEALDSVDEDALDEVLGDKKLQDQTIKATFYLTESVAWMLVKFLDNCEAGDEDMTVAQRVAETPNKEIIVTIRHEPSQDGETMYARVGTTAKAA